MTTLDRKKRAAQVTEPVRGFQEEENRSEY
jgi:hypothetical protein